MKNYSPLRRCSLKDLEGKDVQNGDLGFEQEQGSPVPRAYEPAPPYRPCLVWRGPPGPRDAGHATRAASGPPDNMKIC
jgi:hypothetical protein